MDAMEANLRGAEKPFSIIKLHDRDERCWGVVDARGALIDIDGMSMRLTKAEAQALASAKNASDASEAPLLTAGPH